MLADEAAEWLQSEKDYFALAGAASSKAMRRLWLQP
jgi:hypothetical protein